MRKVLRKSGHKTYWNNRWSSFISDHSHFTNMEMYPIKHVYPIIKKGSKTLEAGCGLGRIIKHFDYYNYNIIGFDYSEVAIQKLKKSSPNLNVIVADISKMPYQQEEFDNILAMGVLHSLESSRIIEKAIRECFRCLKPNGKMVVSVRADNLENYLIDKITDKRNGKGDKFHKWCFKKNEFKSLLKNNGFKIDSYELITNVSFLNKFSFFKKNISSDEKELRSKGFQLNLIGNIIYSSLKFVFKDLFGTTLIVTCSK